MIINVQKFKIQNEFRFQELRKGRANRGTKKGKL